MTDSTMAKRSGTMEVDELDRMLAELSSSEKGYRSGKPFDWNEAVDSTRGVSFENIDGRQVMRLPGRMFAAHAPNPNARGKVMPRPLDGRLFLRRHSRFSPMPEHMHSYLEMSYVYRGNCPQSINGQHALLHENQVLLLDSDCPHAINALGERDIMISICLEASLLTRCLEETRESGDWLSDFLVTALNKEANHNQHILFNSEENQRLRRFFQELMCEYWDPSPHAESIVLHLFQLIVAELMNVYEHDYIQHEQKSATSGVSFVEVVRYLQEHYLTCTLESTAKRFFVSPNYLSSLLKRQTGKTYLQMVQEQKLKHAADLLRRETCTVEEVARSVGYENMSFFYRKFKAAYGCAPAEWRQGGA